MMLCVIITQIFTPWAPILINFFWRTLSVSQSSRSYFKRHTRSQTYQIPFRQRTYVLNSIAWDFFKITFNKLTTAHQIVTTKTMFSFWCTNIRHKHDRGQFKECNFCGYENEDWRSCSHMSRNWCHIFCTGSWAQLRTKMNKWNIHTDIWCFRSCTTTHLPSPSYYGSLQTPPHSDHR
jgi:hypothetical protein